jgi:porin
MQELSKKIITKDMLLKPITSAVVSLGLTVSGVAVAAESNAVGSEDKAGAYDRANLDKNEVLTGRSAKRIKKVKRVRGASRVAGVPGVGHPVYKGEPPMAPPIPACSAQSAAEINKTFGIKLWDFYAFNMGDSIGQDYGCWRTNLAKNGFGFLAWNVGLFQSNMLNHYTPPSSQQVYNGQKSSGLEALQYALTYDLSRWGIPDGQLSIWGDNLQTTNAPSYSQNRWTMEQLVFYGTLFNKQLEYQFGIFNTTNNFQGIYIGGNINNPLGAAAANAIIAGGTVGPEETPGVLIKYHATDTIYNTFYVGRSVPGTLSPTTAGYYQGGNRLVAESYGNPSGFNFSNAHPCVFGICYPSPRELFIDEIGYKQEATPDKLFTWVRATGYYSNTSLYNLAANNGSFADTGSVSILADQQIWQLEPGSPFTAYKGIYIGGTFAYNPPNTSIFTQDYEARIYSFGLFGRPRDQIAFSYQHLVTGSDWANIEDAANGCSFGFACARHATNLYNLTYTANIMSGVYATLGVTYDDHPGLIWSPIASHSGSAAYTAIPPLAPLNIQHAVFFDAALVMVF